MIKLSNIVKDFDTKGGVVHAIKDVSLTIEDGDIYGIIGYSGAGKSTLVRCINLLERPTYGKVFLDDVELTALSDKKLREIRNNIGMIFQHFNLMPSRTVFENVELPLKHCGIDKKTRSKRVIELLEMVELSDRLNSYPSQLSGGQKQRVAIARALACSPKVLLCDEATSALDPQTTNQILNLLTKLNKKLNLTIVIITHQMSVIKQICDKASVMEYGQVVESGTIYDLFANPKSQITKAFVKSSSNLGAFYETLEDDDSLANNIPKGSHIYLLTYTGQSAGVALTAELYKRFNIESNILYGNIDYIKGKPLGKLAINLFNNLEKIDEAIDFIKAQGIQVEVLK